ncbi:uncharacterized protein LOC124200227 isoform X1 [Daphnia pulex]|uniref:uncharacterized protein LOC124200227 isoform X1 n=1 Tax=Daphnia pulex TaxID=6669 RepID=UPI001EDCD97A|nr:uncharacterized protein LOC124200227 isoform X1 [Daphnia pulex]XP_046452356.1 uncharacterized protein LOC124200227 isoform X1 [Daphnia pulex]XP_046452357.1 uncharacterized protein LOC124200227 isoform X1 [Daphnia pulex]
MFTSGFKLPVTSSSPHNSVVSPTHNTWNQHPPESMPWGPLPQHRVTRFSGELDTQSSCTAVSNEPMLLWNTPQENWKLMPLASPIKRKIEDPCEEQVRKQLITEDKISAHLSQLQIGCPTVEHTNCRLDNMEEDSTPTTTCLEGLKIDSCSKLVLSEEILNFQRENSIPASLLENFNKPSMAVVLWQPRNTVHQLVTSSTEEQSCRAALEENPSNGLELHEDESNNNEPIDNFNLNEMASQSDLEMDDDL